jgi:RNA polymerase sigma-70 factor (ECF subfamily)
VGKPELAEDLAQETFLRVLQACDRYDPRYPMRTWMLTIARRLAINHGQRKGNQLRLVDPQQAPPVAQTRPPDQPLIDQEQKQLARDALDEAMQSLSEPQRQAVLLFYQQGLSMEETAQAMELPVNTVKSHLHRARAALKKRLEPQQEKLR